MLGALRRNAKCVGVRCQNPSQDVDPHCFPGVFAHRATRRKTWRKELIRNLSVKTKRATVLTVTLCIHGGQWAIRTPGLWLRRLAAHSSSRYVCILYRRVKLPAELASSRTIPPVSDLLLAGLLAGLSASCLAFTAWNAYGDAPSGRAASRNVSRPGRSSARHGLKALPIPPSVSEAALSAPLPLSHLSKTVQRGPGGLAPVTGPSWGLYTPRTLGCGVSRNFAEKIWRKNGKNRRRQLGLPGARPVGTA